MASKSSDVRPKITLACVECKERNYITKKNRRNDPDRHGADEVLPARPQAHDAPRDPLTVSDLVRRSVLPVDPPELHLGRVSTFSMVRLAMPVDPSLVGRAFPPTAPYEVTEERVRAFAAATGGVVRRRARRRRRSRSCWPSTR